MNERDYDDFADERDAAPETDPPPDWDVIEAQANQALRVASEQEVAVRRTFRIDPGAYVLTSGQEDARAALEALVAANGVHVCAGYAGTGKSVLLIQLAKALRQAGIPYAVVTPTGRAAARLRAGGIEAQTIHSWMYCPIIDEQTHELRGFRKKEEMDLPGRFVLLADEASMLGPTVLMDLLQIMMPSIGGRCIALFGDAFQLPPILTPDEVSEYGENFSMLDRGNVEALGAGWTEMVEVVRQAKASRVLQLATALRSGTGGPMPDMREVTVSRGRRDRLEAQLQSFDPLADQVSLTWTNADRNALNAAARKARGFTRPIEPTERVVVLANHQPLGYANGDLLDLEVIGDPYVCSGCLVRPASFRDPYGVIRKSLIIVIPEVESQSAAKVSPFALAQRVRDKTDELPLVVDYGYCLTVHKAQGCEFQRVQVYAPDVLIKVVGETQARRWLYTAVTRAKAEFWFAGGGILAYWMGA